MDDVVFVPMHPLVLKELDALCDRINSIVKGENDRNSLLLQIVRWSEASIINEQFKDIVGESND